MSESLEHFQKVNRSLDEGLDIIHIDRVSLDHHKAHNLFNVVATWHGIGYEIIHFDILQELSKGPSKSQASTLDRARVSWVRSNSFPTIDTMWQPTIMCGKC